MRNRRIFKIDWRQQDLRWKPHDEILSPRNREWSESDNGKRKNEPGIDPDTKSAIRWIMSRAMDFIEGLHKEYF